VLVVFIVNKLGCGITRERNSNDGSGGRDDNGSISRYSRGLVFGLVRLAFGLSGGDGAGNL
jgi:hypothetical protein